MKRPASQYYWGDWRKDAALQSCSLTARGLWHEMNCIMHDCEPYGHLVIGGRPMGPAQLARLVGVSERECRALLSELEMADVFSRTDEGAIFSRRMVRDERIRNARAEGGKAGSEHGIKGAAHGAKGGRPARKKGGSGTPLKTPLPVNATTPLSTAEEPPPSSSSSSSASSIEEAEREACASPPAPPPVAEPPAKRGTRIPERFPTEAELEWCRQERDDLNAEQVAAKFRDYWVGVPGAKGRKADWPATWRNFVRSERPGRPTSRSQSPPSRSDRAYETVLALTGQSQPEPETIDVLATHVFRASQLR